MLFLLYPLAIIRYAKKHTTHLEFAKLLMWFAQKRLKAVGGKVFSVIYGFILSLTPATVLNNWPLYHSMLNTFLIILQGPYACLWSEMGWGSLSPTLLAAWLCLLPLVPFYVHGPGEIPSVKRVIRKHLHFFLCFIRIRSFNKKKLKS